MNSIYYKKIKINYSIQQKYNYYYYFLFTLVLNKLINNR